MNPCLIGGRTFRASLEVARNMRDHKGRLIGTTVDQLSEGVECTPGWRFFGANPEEVYDGNITLYRTGGAISPEGELCGLYNVGERGDGLRLQLVRLGYCSVRGIVPTAFCFAPLADYYRKIGWTETARKPWNPEYAPKGWDYNVQGKPDVVWLTMRRYTDSLKTNHWFLLGGKLAVSEYNTK